MRFERKSNEREKVFGGRGSRTTSGRSRMKTEGKQEGTKMNWKLKKSDDMRKEREGKRCSNHSKLEKEP